MYYSKSTETLINMVREWFKVNGLNHAIVGYSGGIDSATTAALLHHAGIRTTIVQVCLRGQSLSSTYIAMDFCGDMNALNNNYMHWEYIQMPDVTQWLNNAGKEAALPILRNAFFYGVAAQRRSEGFRPVVVGTVNFDEGGYVGFWGKASDGAQDYYPISHLHKSEVYTLAKELGVPEEIIEAVPSGDLQWSGDLNDYKMIGATYDQIEAIAKAAINVKSDHDISELKALIESVDDVKTFTQIIMTNTHKYDLPFPGVHPFKKKLESFRNYYYPWIISAAIEVSKALRKN